MPTAERKYKIRGIRPSLPIVYMSWAEIGASRSTCKRLKVGSLLVSSDLRRVLGWGYNGAASGEPHCSSTEPGNCGCIHSELNSLLSCHKEPGMIMFCTDSPCLHCAKCIINAGIEILYYRRDYRSHEGLDLLRKKIKVIKI